MHACGEPTSLELLSQVKGQLNCICGTAYPLIPEHDRRTIDSSLKNHSDVHHRFRYVELNGADHGLL